jgi:hypothetical protein
MNFVLVFIRGGVYSKASTWEETKYLVVAFNSTCRYIDDVLSININNFHSYVDLIYSNELEIKDTSKCSTSDVLLKLDTNGKLQTQFYHKTYGFNFSIFNFPYLWSKIPASPAYGVYIYHSLFVMQELARHTFEAVTDKQVDFTRVSGVSLTGSFWQIVWTLQRCYLLIQPFYGSHSVWYVSYQSLSHFWHWSWLITGGVGGFRPFKKRNYTLHFYLSITHKTKKKVKFSSSYFEGVWVVVVAEKIP